jgi:hypothetical protein
MSLPLRPTVRILTVLPSLSNFCAVSRASRAIEELKPPANPRSPVATTSKCTWSLPLPASSSGAPSRPA